VYLVLDIEVGGVGGGGTLVGGVLLTEPGCPGMPMGPPDGMGPFEGMLKGPVSMMEPGPCVGGCGLSLGARAGVLSEVGGNCCGVWPRPNGDELGGAT